MNDFRCVLRQLRENLSLAGIVVLALIVGIGGSTGVGWARVRAGVLSDEADGWQAAVLEAQAEMASLDPRSEALTAAAEAFSARGEREFPVYWDWWLQDTGSDFGSWLSASTMPAAAQEATAKVLAELAAAGQDLRMEYDRLVGRTSPLAPRSRAGTHDLREQGQDDLATGQWLELYLRAAELRREVRLRNLCQQYPRWIFTKHHTLGGSHYAYTEGQSDAQHERQFDPDAALCRLEIDGARVRVHTLIEDSDGVIRDPDVSWDGRRVLFAWKKSDREDDYHLYEMKVADGSVKQLTDGLGFADYEGVYLPNGDLLFNSTRCVQTVDCWWTEVSNLYTCGGDGRYLRRLTFDQVHDNYPTVMPDGRVVYTRWEYSDRGQLFVQGLFQMNPDGTGQTELYGNNSWFPTSLLHARGIPGTCYLQDVHAGPGLAGVSRGAVKKLRVIALSYRAVGVGWNYNAGPAGDALVSTPVSIGNGSWDVKTVLGEATVYADGSALFTLPVRTPVPEDLAKRRWTASYLALVHATEQTLEGHRYLAGVSNDLVNWVSAQSGPEMLPPYAAGAARSRLLSMLVDGHYGLQVTPGEMERLACWIDLQVPFCGDYEEANLWTADDQQKYRHFLDKRRRMEDLERRSIAEWLRRRPGDTQGPAAR